MAWKKFIVSYKVDTGLANFVWGIENCLDVFLKVVKQLLLRRVRERHSLRVANHWYILYIFFNVRLSLSNIVKTYFVYNSDNKLRSLLLSHRVNLFIYHNLHAEYRIISKTPKCHHNITQINFGFFIRFPENLFVLNIVIRCKRFRSLYKILINQ